jgi:hypothetical protein
MVQIPRKLLRDTPFASDPDLNFWHPRPAAFVALWRSLVPPGRLVPSRALFTPQVLKDFLPYLLVIDMDESRQHYRNRLVGTEVAARNGRDVTGRWHDEIYSPETLSGHHRAYQWVITQQRPLRVHGTMDYVDRGYILVETAVIPLSLERPDHIEQFITCVAYGEPRED